MVKKVAVIALDPRASAFYGKQVQELFGEYVKVNSYSVREGTISNMERADLYLMSTDAFDNREDVPQYIPIEAQISEIHVTYLWETIRLLRTIPAGTRALFVNMTEKMVREATSGLNQLGVNHIEFTLLSGSGAGGGHWPGCHTGRRTVCPGQREAGGQHRTALSDFGDHD